MIRHLVRNTANALADGKGAMIAQLAMHGEDHDWNECGITSWDAQCMAIAASTTGGRCQKRAVVAMEFRLEYSALDSMRPLGLCGGHFIVHRSGKPVQLIYETGR